MTTPPPILHRLQHTLAQWRHWHCDPPLTARPALSGPLSGGVSNFSFIVGTKRRYVVRIDGVDPRAHGINRQCEWRTLNDAFQAGIGPRPCYFNPDLGALVCDYLDADTTGVATPALTGQLVRKIHQLPHKRHRLHLGERIQRYEKRLRESAQWQVRQLLSYSSQVMHLLENATLTDEEPRLCHNDLLQPNRLLSEGTLYALDWEYCAMGSRWYDFAVIVEGDKLGQHQTEQFLACALDAQPQDVHYMELERFRRGYRYLELLWYAVTEGTADTTTWQSRLTALEERLSASHES